jgi:hypothetical protein
MERKEQNKVTTVVVLSLFPSASYRADDFMYMKLLQHHMQAMTGMQMKEKRSSNKDHRGNCDPCYRRDFTVNSSGYTVFGEPDSMIMAIKDRSANNLDTNMPCPDPLLEA